MMTFVCCNFNSGDQDSVIPFTGTRMLVNKLALDLGLNTTVPYGTWFQGRQVSRFLFVCLFVFGFLFSRKL